MTIKTNEFGMIQFDDKEVVATAKIEIGFTAEEIDDIVVGAIEGGIGYWARLENEGENWKDKPREVAPSQWATHLLLQGKEVIFSDAELEEGDKDYYYPALTLKKLMKGIVLNHKERPHDNDIERGDATTCDCIIQYAIFGEVVYG